MEDDVIVFYYKCHENQKMLSFFSPKTNDRVGIDIGTSAIKIVHLDLGGEKPVFRNFAIARLRKGLLQSSGQVIASHQISKILSMAFTKSNIKCKNVSFSIPSFSSFISFITIPKTFEGELESKIEIEARKYIPVPISEISLGWELINEIGGAKSMEVKPQEKKIKVLLMAVSKNVIEKYESIARDCKLNLHSIEVESMSLMRSLVGDDKRTSLILDIGSRICNILIVAEGSLRGSRNIDVGGGDFSEAIARSLNVDFVRSEAMKKEWGMKESQLSSIIAPVVERIIQEVKRMLDLYNKKNPTRPVERMILSGGTAKLRGVKEYLEEKIGLEIVLGNPWGSVEYDRSNEQLLQNFKDEMAVAIGLALKRE